MPLTILDILGPNKNIGYKDKICLLVAASLRPNTEERNLRV